MEKLLRLAALSLGLLFSATSCVLTGTSIKEADSFVRFERQNFEMSAQVTGEATSTRILGIDWARLFTRQSTAINETRPNLVAALPVVGTLLSDRVAGYALYNMMQANKGYDVIFYPQYEKVVERPILIPIYTKIRVKATARLGKIK
jgi:hypothetical protein